MSDAGKAVFLSYASQDAEAAQRVCEALRQAGVEVWFDQNELVGGDAWDQKIRRQIKECALLIPIVSANTQARTEGYFRLEWRLADQRTHLMAKGRPFLLPVVVDATRDTEAHVPDSFLEVQWTKAPGGEVSPAFAAQVKKLLSGEVGPVSDRPSGSSAPSEAGQRSAPPRKRPLWLIPVIVLVAVAAGIWQQRRNSGKPGPAAPPATTSPASAELARLRARIIPDRWQQGDFEALSPVIDRLIDANPDKADAWALRSIINSLQVVRILDTGTQPLATGRTAAERAVRLDPESGWANLALGLHHTAMVSRGGDPLASRAPIERALRVLPPDALTRYAGLVSPWLAFDFDTTERRIEEWLQADPAASYPTWIRGSKALVLRRTDDVLKWAERAASDANITGVRALSNLADAHFYLRADLAATRATLDRIPAQWRSVARVVYWRWQIAMAEQRWDEALQVLAQSPEPFLADVSYHGPKALLAGLAHQRAGRADAAAVQFRAAERLLREKLAEDTENEAFRLLLAVALANQDRATETRAELALVEPQIRDRPPNNYRGRLLVALVQAYGALGEPAKLAFWMRKMLAEPLNPPLTPASFRLDARFNAFLETPEIRALLAEFAYLDARPAATADPKLQPPGLTAPSPVSIDAKSVAVLAFANLSDDKANEYFSDGISEELLNVLAKVPGLKVSARTSAFFFKGKEVPIPEIAKQLGVSYVVEGSVRKQGDKVRITAQLIKAADGFHLWSDTFTRDLKDIFAVQDEIAGLVAKNLELKLGLTKSGAAAAANPEASRLYFEAMAAWNERSPVSILRAQDLLTKALGLEPRFARAKALLSQAVGLGASEGLPGMTTAVALQLADEALDLDPFLAPAHAARGSALGDADRLDEATAELRRAIKLDPNYATGHQWLGRNLSAQGRMEEALASLRRAAELDPLSHRILDNYAQAQAWSGDLPGALATLDRALQLQPTSVQARHFRASYLQRLGRADEAIVILSDPEVANALPHTHARVLMALHRPAEAGALLAFARGDFGRGLMLCALGRSAEGWPLLKPSKTLHREFILWEVADLLPRNDPAFRQALADWGLNEAWSRAEAWRAAHSPSKEANE